MSGLFEVPIADAQGYLRLMALTDHRTYVSAAGAAAALVLSAGLVPTRGRIDSSVVALALACLVVAAGSLGGRTSAVVTAAYGALGFDFFHTMPYGHLKVRNLDDVLAMVLLVVLGVWAGGIADRLRRLRARRSGMGEVRRLIRVAERASLGDSIEALTHQVTAELTDTLQLRTCWYEPAPFVGLLPEIEPDGGLSSRIYRWAKDGFELPADGVAIPFRVAGQLQGRFVLGPSPGQAVSLDRRMLANAIVDQLGAVLAMRTA